MVNPRDLAGNEEEEESHNCTVHKIKTSKEILFIYYLLSKHSFLHKLLST